MGKPKLLCLLCHVNCIVWRKVSVFKCITDYIIFKILKYGFTICNLVLYKLLTCEKYWTWPYSQMNVTFRTHWTNCIKTQNMSYSSCALWYYMFFDILQFTKKHSIQVFHTFNQSRVSHYYLTASFIENLQNVSFTIIINVYTQPSTSRPRLLLKWHTTP